MIDNKIAIFLGFANDSSEEKAWLDTIEPEEQKIDDALNELRNQSKCFLIKDRKLTHESLFQKLQEHRNSIDIFHFSGHTQEGQLLLESAEFKGETKPLSINSICTFIENQLGGIKLFFLNACNTQHQGEMFLERGAHLVITSNSDVDEDLAFEFSTSFYKSLATGSSVRIAFDEARAALRTLEDNDDIINQWSLISKNKKLEAWTPFPKEPRKNTLTILQISDTINRDTDFSSIEKSEKIDFVICSGNVTNNGDYTNLINTLRYEVDCNTNRIFCCPGIDDLDKSKIIPAIHNSLNSCLNTESLNDFISSKEQFKQSYNSSLNFKTSVSNHYPDDNKNKTGDLYTAHIRNYSDKRIGIVCINSVWNLNGKMTNILYPINLLEEAFEFIKTTDYKILVSNQDLSNFKPFNRRETENFVYPNFDFLLSGAIVEKYPQKELTSDEGIFQSYSGKNISKTSDYIVHTFDLENKKVTSNTSIFSDSEGAIIEDQKTICKIFPNGAEKNKQVKLLKVLDKQFYAYKEVGDKLFVEYSKEGKSFLDLFTTPILKDKPIEEIQSLNNNTVLYHNKYNNLFAPNKNFLVYGKDKYGKSSLLVYICTSLLNQFNSTKIIPIYIDLKEFKDKSDKFELLNIIRNKLEGNKKDTSLLLQKYHFKILLDNFDPKQTEISRRFGEFLNRYPLCSYILTSNQTTVRTYEDLNFGFNHFQKLYIHDLPKSSVRILARKTMNGSEKDIDEVVQKLVQVFRQYKMPSNYWTVSVFLYIYTNRRIFGDEIRSNAELVELYIQELLGRKELARVDERKQRFGFDKYRQYLSFLAYKLYENHEPNGYSANYATLTKYTEEFISNNKRSVENPKNVIDYVVERGVLKRISDDNYTFRLNGAFEYFLAYQLKRDKKFLNKILSDDNVYLTFRNELDLYSSIIDDTDKEAALLKIVYQKAKTKFKKYNKDFEARGNIDQNLIKSSKGAGSFDIIKGLNVDNLQPLSYDKKDEIELDVNENNRSLFTPQVFENEVKIKKTYDEISNEHEILESHLFILSRVFRNIDGIEDADIEGLDDDEIFRFIIDSTCNLGFLLVEEMMKETDESLEIQYGLPARLLKLFRVMLPLIIQGFFYDSIGHIKLEEVIKSEIKSLKRDAQNNQFKLFILYFTLIDLNLKENKEYLDELYSLTTLSVLKHSILSKMLFYLMFKAYDNKNLIGYLKSRLREYQMKIDPKTDTRLLEKKLSEFEKLAIIKRRSIKYLNTDDK